MVKKKTSKSGQVLLSRFYFLLWPWPIEVVRVLAFVPRRQLKGKLQNPTEATLPNRLLKGRQKLDCT